MHLRPFLLLAFMFAASVNPCRGEDEKPLMKWESFRGIATQYFNALPPKRYAGLMVWEDLKPLLDEMEKKGWAVPYRDEVEKRMVKQGEFLATFAQSEPGAKYLNATTDQLLLDRIDRISRVPGGQEALGRVVRLPNAVDIKPTRSKSFMPSLADMLPLKGGKKPPIKDYDKPTNRAYSQKQVLTVMQQFHQIAMSEAGGKSTQGAGNR